MSNLAADKVLRVNCPGWGVSSTLPLGEAKPLAMYDVIVINPTSIIHLFEPKSDTAKQVDKLLADGATNLKLDSDSTLESISAELELREHELRQFLSKGGLLIYFLAPPFTVGGASLSMDNYLWLYENCPDKSEGSERAIVPATVKNAGMTGRGKRNIFAPYLEQFGSASNSHIKKEQLTDGYAALAVADDKVVAGVKSSGPKRGQVVFLPAPYDTKSDDLLKECILKWQELRTGPDADKADDEVAEEAPAAKAEKTELESKDNNDNEPDIEGKDLLDDLFADDSDSAKKNAPYDKPAAASGASDFDALDALFAPSGNKAESKNDLFNDEPPASKKLIDADKLFDDNKLFDDPSSSSSSPVSEKKKSTLDWPELEDDVPPFAKEREEEKKREKAREEEKARAEEKAREEKARDEEKSRDEEKAREEEKSREEEKARAEEKAREEEKSREEEEAKAKEKERKEREEEKAREEERAKEREQEEAKEKERKEREEKDREEERAKEEARKRDEEKAREEERAREKEREEKEAREREEESARQREKEEKEKEERAKEEERDRQRDEERAMEREREERQRERDRARAEEEEREREAERAREEERQRERDRIDDEERKASRDREERDREKAYEEERERDKAREMKRELDRLREEEDARKKTREEQRERDLARNGSDSNYPEAKDLMSRLEQEISSPGVPDWCQKVSFSELKQLHVELTDLNEQVRRAKQKINDVEDRIQNLGELKDALLSLSGVRLTQACCKVFEALGWSVKISESSASEIYLSDADKTQAIVRVVFSQTQPNRSELAELAESVITYWGKHDVEPKGILVASTFADRAPKERTDEDFPGSMGEFAKRKNLCLFTCMQLLTIYRDISLKSADVRKIRENLLTTSGILPGFKMETMEKDNAKAEEAAAK